MTEETLRKLVILAESAKYDVSCSSSGVGRKRAPGGVGNAEGWGICHSFAADGRCISLLKILYTNHCEYDCAYCVNRAGNDVPRAAFSPRELAELTIEFYRRNYIEGLFLSSGVVKSPDHTMERLVAVLRLLRVTHRFNGYIHMKAIPGASAELVRQAGLYADRLSVNIEIPSEGELKRLAPEKDHQGVYLPMRRIHEGILENQEERHRFRSAPTFAPAGQSTQMIIGASSERDREILRLSTFLYQGPELKRVYYSGFVPVNGYDSRLPALRTPPLAREHRLYQADWLMRFYRFQADELTSDTEPDLDLDLDPKLIWALRHPEFFPVDPQRAGYEAILRVPGIGVTSALRIVEARRHTWLRAAHLKAMGVAMNRAGHFLRCPDAVRPTIQEKGPLYVKALLSPKKKPGALGAGAGMYQLSLF